MTDRPTDDPSKAAEESLHEFEAAVARIQAQLSKTIVGQKEVIEQALIAILTASHALLVGPPGLAKTLLVSSLARTMHLSFKRIQFTPDLMPGDITGSELLAVDPATGDRQFKFVKGPIFANIVLADEINRTPPKTQAATLEAMQEGKVTVGGMEYPLPQPFFLLATQNPIEQEGTYPLPEAQLDRFMFMITVDYPGADEEGEILRLISEGAARDAEAVVEAAEVRRLQNTVRQIPVGPHVYDYAQKLVRASRPGTPEAFPVCDQYLKWGAGPRAGLNLILAAKARAAMRGEILVRINDIRAVAAPVLRHRLLPNFRAQTEGLRPDAIIDEMLKEMPSHP